ncbi:MAG: hypothetical protein JRD49_07470 [Deltaproteobacteria bacterium]|nr:hypothetical protein [Deltaproteobacteria bacterium]MBW2677395.1 hypothetical protein [Deltaproteobacteria bacterium]
MKGYIQIYTGKGKPKDDGIQAARKGMQRVRKAMLSGDYDVIVVDEGNAALALTYRLYDV